MPTSRQACPARWLPCLAASVVRTTTPALLDHTGAPLPRAGIAACAFCGKLAPEGQLRTCGSCKRVAYCSRDCQVGAVCVLADRMSWTAVALCVLAAPQELRQGVSRCRLGHLQPDLCSSPPLPTRRRSRTGSRAATSNSALTAAQAGRRRLTVALPLGRRAGQMMVVQRQQEAPRSSRCLPTPFVRRS